MILGDILAYMSAKQSGDTNFDGLAKSFFKYKTLSDIGDTVSGKLLGLDSTQDLQNENIKLDILTKKRRLGLDMNDSADYDESTYKSDALRGMAGSELSRFLRSQNSIPKQKSLTSVFKTAEHAGYEPHFKIATLVDKSPVSSSEGLLKNLFGSSSHATGTNRFLHAILRR